MLSTTAADHATMSPSRVVPVQERIDDRANHAGETKLYPGHQPPAGEVILMSKHADLMRLADQGRLRELESSLAAAGDKIESQTLAAVTVELAVRGRRHLLDLWRAAVILLEADDPLAAWAQAELGRRMGRIGAQASARRIGALLDAHFPEASETRLFRSQIEAQSYEGEREEIVQALTALRRGDAENACAILAVAIAQGVAQPDAYTLLGRVQLGRGEFQDAARAFAAAAACWPKADALLEFQLAQGLALWAAGQVDAAVAVWRQVGSAAEYAGSDVDPRAEARGFLAAFERHGTSVAPAWCLGPEGSSTGLPSSQAGRAACSRALAFAGATQPVPERAFANVAELRWALTASDVLTRRIVIEKENLEGLIASGTLIILAEEQPVGTGFLLLRGYEPKLGLLWMEEPGRPGAILRGVDRQWQRCALLGRGALVVLGAGSAAKKRATALNRLGCKDDERLLAIDACDLDEAGRPLPRARIEGLSEEAITRAPDVAVAWQRRGEALLDCLRHDELDEDERPLERWYAEARTHFPDGEWAAQIYAQFLESRDRLREADVAWSDATNSDPFDFRNYLGMARVRLALGEPAAARVLDQTLLLGPHSVEAWTLRARLALVQGNPKVARFAAELASELGPDNVEADLVRGTVLERSDDSAGAVAAFASAAQHAPRSAEPQLRLCRRRLLAGDWNGAAATARALLEIAPQSWKSWTDASYVSFAQGDIQQAFALGHRGLERCGPYAGITEQLGNLIAATVPDNMVAELATGLSALCERNASALMRMGSQLAEHDRPETGLMLIDAWLKAAPDDVNARWRQAQILLLMSPKRRPATWRQDLLALLQRILTDAEGFPYPCAVLAWLLMNEDPTAAAAALRSGNTEQAPALLWGMQRELAVRQGRSADQNELSARLASLGVDAVIDAAHTMIDFGLPDAATALLPATLAPSSSLHMTWAAIALAENKAQVAWEQVEAARALAPEDGNALLAARAALAAAKWSLLEAVCDARAAQHARDTSDELHDAWPARAMAAAAAAAQGRPQAREALLQQAGQHPLVLAALYQVERISDPPTAETRRARLLEMAPGLVGKAERGGVWS
jgi:tetratricopeptide (TPR) repeat protein